VVILNHSTILLESLTDVENWDLSTAGAAKHHVFQTAGWSFIKLPTGWRALRIAVNRAGVFRAGIQMLERDFPKIGYRFFYSPRGPVLSAEWAAEDIDELFSRVERVARERRVVFLKIDPDVSKGDDWITESLVRNRFRQAPETGGFSGVQPRWVFRLDISKSEDDILKGMDQKTRYNIRLAERKGVTIRPIEASEEIETFYRILVDTARRDGFLIRPVVYFQDIQKYLATRGQAKFFLAESEGKPIAGALALTHGKTAWYAYGASANTDRHYMPNHLMQWTMIRWAKSLGCTLYDFRAVPSNPKPEDPLYGLYRFKKGFGAELTEFVGEYDRVYVPWVYVLWVRAWPIFKKIRRAILLRPSRSTRPEAD